MSYYEDQEAAWLENDCIGQIEDYNPHDPDSWPRRQPKAPRKKRALHCVNCKQPIREDGRCPNVTDQPKKQGKFPLVINCAN